MRLSQLFTNRWMALVWAAGIAWMAVDLSSGGQSVAPDNQQAVTDVTGAPVSNEEVKELEETIANL